MEYLYIIVSAIVILFATYGMFSIISETVMNYRIRKNTASGMCKCIFFVKNRENDIEYIVRKTINEIGPFLGGHKYSFTIVDMGSTDETTKIVAALNEEYSEINVKYQNV